MKTLRTFAFGSVFLLSACLVRAEESRLFSHTAENGDTLIKLAKRYLVRQDDWQIFEKFNVVKNPRQIPVGTVIKIPVSAMRTDPASAEIIATRGSVSVGAGALSRGSKIKEGDRLITGDESFVTILLADGSTLTVQPKSSLHMETARQLVNSGGVTDTVVRLETGRVEANVVKQRNAGARYEIRTPTSNMGVRGTAFRAGADVSGKRGQVEVVEGLVDVASTALPTGSAVERNAAVYLRSGFGTYVDAGKVPVPPIALLAAPDVKSLPAQIQRPDARFSFPAVPAAVSYRAQVATDITFTNPVANASSSTPDVVFVNLPDGTFRLRVRAVDVNGLEGKDATHGFAVKARPVPPVITQPGDGSRLPQGRVELAWLAAPDAAGYRVQLADDAQFAKPGIDQVVASGEKLAAATLVPGAYFWRVASMSSKGDSGPWSAAQSFVSVAETPVLTATRRDGKTLLDVDRSSAISHQVQISRDEKFINVIVDRVSAGNRFDIGELAAEVYYIRVRGRDDAGQAIGNWSEMHMLEVYAAGGGWWLSRPLSVPASASK